MPEVGINLIPSYVLNWNWNQVILKSFTFFNSGISVFFFARLARLAEPGETNKERNKSNE